MLSADDTDQTINTDLNAQQTKNPFKSVLRHQCSIDYMLNSYPTTELKMINIRTAKTGDVPQLVELLKALFAIEADFDFDQDKQARGLQLLLKCEQACILVAESRDGKKLCGMCSIQILISTAEGGEVGLLEDLVVAADFRNQGIGAKLLAEAVAWAERQGLKRLQLLADKNNSPALEFYEKQGWQSTQLVCLKRLLKSG